MSNFAKKYILLQINAIHYDEEMAFEFDRQTGIIKDKVTGERCVIITQAKMQEISSRLSEIF